MELKVRQAEIQAFRKKFGNAAKYYAGRPTGLRRNLAVPGYQER
jgi:hypothetical protein